LYIRPYSKEFSVYAKNEAAKELPYIFLGVLGDLYTKWLSLRFISGSPEFSMSRTKSAKKILSRSSEHPLHLLDRLSMLVIIVPVKVDKSGSAPRPAPPLLDTTDKKSSHLQIGPRTKPFQSTTRLEPVT
jgi:hypothetical protein